jgi:asparagine synthase (glutamine-hydrolysing)
MLYEMPSDDQYNTTCFGGFSPFYYKYDQSVLIADTFDELYKKVSGGQWELDTAALLSLINFNYILGDRTLVKGVGRVPWHSTLDADGLIKRHSPIRHFNNLYSSDTIADQLLVLLELVR